MPKKFILAFFKNSPLKTNQLYNALVTNLSCQSCPGAHGQRKNPCLVRTLCQYLNVMVSSGAVRTNINYACSGPPNIYSYNQTQLIDVVEVRSGQDSNLYELF